MTVYLGGGDDLFNQLELGKRWRAQQEEIAPIRVEAPPLPPEDPLVEMMGQETEGEGAEVSPAGEEQQPAQPPAPTPQPVTRAEPQEDDGGRRIPIPRPRLGIGDALRNLAKSAASMFIEDDEGEEAGQAEKAPAIPPQPAPPRPGPRFFGRVELPEPPQPKVPKPSVAAEGELVVFVGALPHCGTTTSLVGWALARAEAGEEVVAIDAHAERPTLPVHVMGRVANAGWLDTKQNTVLHLKRYVVEVPGVERFRIIPLAWQPALDPANACAIQERLPLAVDTAKHVGASTIAVDLGSFRPICNGNVDLRLKWAARAADVVVVVTFDDVLGLDAAARMIVALRSEQAKSVVLIVVGDWGSLAAKRVHKALMSLQPPAPVDSVVPVPWDKAITQALGKQLPPLRIGALYPKQKQSVA